MLPECPCYNPQYSDSQYEDTEEGSRILCGDVKGRIREFSFVLLGFVP